MRFYSSPVLVAILASLSVADAHAQAYGEQSNKIASDANGPGSYRTAPSAFGASEMSLMHRQRCALTPSQSKAAEKLAEALVERARSAWDGANHQPPANREAEVERALVRALERGNDCSIISHRAVSLARAAFSQIDPSNQAFDLTLTAMDAVDDGDQSCDCRPTASTAPAFGGPPLGNSGGGGGGVTHPPVAPPQ